MQFFGSALAKIGISLTEMIVAVQFFGYALTKIGITISLAEMIVGLQFFRFALATTANSCTCT